MNKFCKKHLPGFPITLLEGTYLVGWTAVPCTNLQKTWNIY